MSTLIKGVPTDRCIHQTEDNTKTNYILNNFALTRVAVINKISSMAIQFI